MKFENFGLTLFLVALIPLALAAQVTREHEPVPLKPWPAPLYWQPALSEVRANASQTENAIPSITPPSLPSSLVFVAMTPCRVVDTRAGQGFSGAFGPPFLVGGASRTFPIQSSTNCTIPSIAQAYSFNVTVVPSGLLGFVTVFPTGTPLPNASTLNSLQGFIVANAAIVPAGTNGSVDVFASQTTDIVIDINGFYASPTGITVAQGTAGTPSLSFAGDAGTGIFSSGAGNVSIANGGNTSLTVTPSGLVGIGTTSPAGILHARGASPVRLLGDTTTLSGTEYVDFFAHTSIFGSDLGGMRIQRQASGNIDTSFFAAQAANAAVEKMRVTGTGNVGIGTPNPQGALHVFSASPTRILGEPATRQGSEYVDFFASQSFGNRDLGGMRIQRQGDGSFDTLFFTAAPVGTAVEAVRIKGKGNVGLGTSSPRDVLEVVGNIRVDNGCVTNGSGTQIAGTCSSDERLKTNIEPFAPVLEKAVRLQPVRFDWRADEYPEYHFGSERSYGLIAQEAEKVLPELVSTDKHGFKAVNYSELPLVLLQAMRDLNAENQQLKSRLAAVEELLSRMTAVTDGQ